MVVFIYVGAWLAVSPATFDWPAGATVCSVPDDPYYPACRASGYPCDLCQAAELLRVESRARNELTELDDEEPEVIKERRLQERRLPEHSLLPSAPPS